jgi:hypothetical protein
MVKKAVVPDAWDDDWEPKVENGPEKASATAAEEQTKVSKAERLAKHAEMNKKLWQSASV